MSLRHTPSGPRVPVLVANEVTIRAFTALAKATALRHCWRVSTVSKPSGAFSGGRSVSAK
jgi:hypothetical protein